MSNAFFLVHGFLVALHGEMDVEMDAANRKWIRVDLPGGGSLTYRFTDYGDFRDVELRVA